MGWLLIATEEGDIGRKAKGRSEVEIDLCAGGVYHLPRLITLPSINNLLSADLSHLRHRTSHQISVWSIRGRGRQATTDDI